jgi:hypothetical protein
MFAFADPQRIVQALTAAGWAPPRLDKLDFDLDAAAGRGLEEAVVSRLKSVPVSSWLRGASRQRSSQPPQRPSARR